MIILINLFYITKQVHYLNNIVSMKNLHIRMAHQTFPIKSSYGFDGKLQRNLQGWVYMGSTPYTSYCKGLKDTFGKESLRVGLHLSSKDHKNWSLPK